LQDGEIYVGVGNKRLNWFCFQPRGFPDHSSPPLLVVVHIFVRFANTFSHQLLSLRELKTAKCSGWFTSSQGLLWLQQNSATIRRASGAWLLFGRGSDMLQSDNRFHVHVDVAVMIHSRLASSPKLSSHFLPKHSPAAHLLLLCLTVSTGQDDSASTILAESSIWTSAC
jgi:hypothetical protein